MLVVDRHFILFNTEQTGDAEQSTVLTVEATLLIVWIARLNALVAKAELSDLDNISDTLVAAARVTLTGVVAVLKDR